MTLQDYLNQYESAVSSVPKEHADIYRGIYLRLSDVSVIRAFGNIEINPTWTPNELSHKVFGCLGPQGPICGLDLCKEVVFYIATTHIALNT